MTKSELRDRLMRDKDTMHALKNLDKIYINSLTKCWSCKADHPPLRVKTFTESSFKAGKAWNQNWVDKSQKLLVSDPLVVAAPKKWYE
jgi:hypothetical protein